MPWRIATQGPSATRSEEDVLMHGPDFPRPSGDTVNTLGRASTATVSTILKYKGVRNVYMRLHPLLHGMKAVGPALTIRTVPGREDLQPVAYAAGTLYPGHPDDAIEAVRPGDMVVLDGGGATDEGLFGDLLTLRIKMKGAAGIVSDMCVRDSPHMPEKKIPIFCLGAASPGGTVFNVDYNVPIRCARVLVCPGDIVLADDDGAIVIPTSMVAEVVDAVVLHEDREEYIRLMLARGTPLEGLYPMGEAMEMRFLEWRRTRSK
jgi:regulator of RNase E activity RraA